MGAFERYYQLTQQQNQQPLSPVTQQQAVQQPQIDTSDPINSLAGMLVTPAEREAREQKMLQNKRRMIAWTGLFDGLRQLGNLYYTTQGATPQQYTDKPYQQIEQDYQDEVKRQSDLMAHRDRYAAQLWNLQRQANEDARKKALSDAQAKWYGSREEMAQQKAELEKLKAVRVIKQKDGSLMKFDPVSGSIEPLTEADPLYVNYMNSRINATNKRAGLLGAPVTTTTTDAKGNTKTSVKTYGKSGASTKEKGTGGTKGNGKTIKGYTKSGNSSKSVTRKGKAYGK